MQITNLNFVNQSSTSRNLRVTVQPKGASAALISVSLAVAGVSASLSDGVPGQISGLLTPAFPVSYFSYSLRYFDNQTVLALGIYSGPTVLPTRRSTSATPCRTRGQAKRA